MAERLGLVRTHTYGHAEIGGPSAAFTHYAKGTRGRTDLECRGGADTYTASRKRARGLGAPTLLAEPPSVFYQREDEPRTLGGSGAVGPPTSSPAPTRTLPPPPPTTSDPPTRATAPPCRAVTLSISISPSPSPSSPSPSPPPPPPPLPQPQPQPLSLCLAICLARSGVFSRERTASIVCACCLGRGVELVTGESNLRACDELSAPLFSSRAVAFDRDFEIGTWGAGRWGYLL
jgi:hypothetical protein